MQGWRRTALDLQFTVLDASTAGEIDAVFRRPRPAESRCSAYQHGPISVPDSGSTIVQLARVTKFLRLYFLQRVRRCRGPDELWTEYAQQRLSTGGNLRRSHSKR